MRRFEELVPRIYDAALDQAQWPVVLTAVADHLGAIGGMIARQMPGPEGSAIIVGRLDPDLTTRYLAEYTDNPWSRGFSRASAGQPLVAGSIVEPAVIRRTAFHADILAPQRIVDLAVALYAPWTRRPGDAGGIAFALDSRAVADTGTVMRRYARLVPHLMRALDLGTAVAATGSASASVIGILDALSDAALALDIDGRVRIANTAGEALLRAADGLQVTSRGGYRSPRLAAADSDDDRALAKLIGQAGACGQGRGTSAGGRLRISRPSGRIPLLVAVLPLPRPRGVFAAVDDPAVLIIVNDPEAPTREDDLRTSFGLTMAEARLAALIITGLGLPAAAQRLGVSRETARSHLARCFDKTGARSQAALVRLAAALPRR